MNERKQPIAEDTPVTAEEPAALALSESIRRGDLLGQVMKLSPTDKVALIRYLKHDVGQDEPFRTDEFGRITLNLEMRAAIEKAGHDYEEGRCLTEDAFKQRFSKWL